MQKPIYVLLIALTLFLPTYTHSQNNLFSKGYPYIRNYSYKDYKGHAQCWQIDQDDDGMLFFGNSRGMLSYDGYKWNISALPKKNILRLIKIDKDGRIYVGGVNEFGYMELAKDGSYAYTSLVEKLPEEEREVNNIRSIIILDGKVYFQFYYKIVIYDLRSDTLTYIKPTKAFIKAYLLHNNIYITSADLGLLKLVGDTTEAVSEAVNWTNKGMFSDIVEWSPETWLVATNESLLFYSNGIFSPIKTEADDFFKKNTIQQLLVAPDKSIIVSTLDDGLVHISSNGQILQFYNLEKGLINSKVHHVFVDKEGALWITTDQGISKLEYHNPIRLYDKRSGIFGTVEVVKAIGNDVYIGSGEGFYKLSGSDNISKVQVLKDKFWTRFIQPYREGKIIVGGGGHLLEFDGKSFKAINRGGQTFYWISASAKDPDRFYVATSMGFLIIRKENGSWKEYFAADRSITSDCRFVQEDTDGTVWLGAADNSLYKISINETNLNRYEFKKYDVNNGLPVSQINATLLGNKMYFLSEKGVFEYIPNEEKFVPSNLLENAIPNDRVMVPRMVANKDRQFYFTYGFPPNMRTGVMTADTLLREELKFVNNRLMRVEGASWWTVDADSVNNQIWFGGTDGVVCYSPGNYFGKYNPFYAHISSITLNRDSVLYRNINVKKFSPDHFTLTNNYNTIRFDYALPYYDDVDNNQFQFYLEGFDEDWSALTKEKYVEYTGLPSGSYVFKIRAQSIYGDWSEIAQVSFYVAPPWYLSWWFITAVSILFISLLVIIVRYFSTLKLIKRVEELEMQQKVQRERDRISSDLHDHVGAQLTSIISGLQMTETIGGDMVQNPQFKQLVESLKEDAQVTITHLRDTIWTLKEEEITPSEFSEHIQKFAESVLKYREKPIFNIQNTASDDIKLNPTVALNITRVVEEAIHNAIKHAHADTLEVSLVPVKNQLTISVKDNGKGFQTDKGQGSEHYGLENMKRRISEVGGTLVIHSKEGEGTSIEVSVSL